MITFTFLAKFYPVYADVRRRMADALGARGIAYVDPFAGFADLDTDIDDAGGKAFAVAVDDIDALIRLYRAVFGCGDHSVFDTEPAQSVGLRLWVDQAGVGEKRRHHDLLE